MAIEPCKGLLLPPLIFFFFLNEKVGAARSLQSLDWVINYQGDGSENSVLASIPTLVCSQQQKLFLKMV